MVGQQKESGRSNMLGSRAYHHAVMQRDGEIVVSLFPETEEGAAEAKKEAARKNADPNASHPLYFTHKLRPREAYLPRGSQTIEIHHITDIGKESVL